ncbi:hypothetical protein EAE96_000972 [Botrytis aclada]|nr:hypothetical protein EAE96_000972 [Botrytis aclada]
MDKSNQESTTLSMHDVRPIEKEENFTKFAFIPDEIKFLIWEFAVVAIPPRVIEFEANLPNPDGRHIGTLIKTGRATKVYRYGDNVWPIIDYHGRLTFRCAFSSEFQHANGSPPALLHTTRASRKIALRSYQCSFSSFLERPIFYNSEKDLVYIDRPNNARRDITYRKDPFERASEEDKKRITHLAFIYDNLHLESNPWLDSYIRYSVQQLTNVHMVTFLLRKSAIEDLQDNKAHRVGTLVLDRKERDSSIIRTTKNYGSADKDKVEEEKEEKKKKEAELIGVSDIDAAATGSGHFDSSGGHVDGYDSDDEWSSDDSDDDSVDSWPHVVSPRRYYKGMELTAKQLKNDWKLARWEWWKPIWEEFFHERSELPSFIEGTFPKEELPDNPDWIIPNVQLLSFEELGCPISIYNRHYLYPEEESVCSCQSDDEFEML